MMMTSEGENSCCGDSDKVQQTMATLPKNSAEEGGLYQGAPTIPEELVHLKATPCLSMTSTEELVQTEETSSYLSVTATEKSVQPEVASLCLSVTATEELVQPEETKEASPCILVRAPQVVDKFSETRRGTKRNIGEVSEPETSDVDNANKSSKVNLLPRSSNIHAKQMALAVTKQIQIANEGNSRLLIESLHNGSIGGRSVSVKNEPQDDTELNQTEPLSTASYTNDDKSAIDIRTNSAIYNFIESSCDSIPNINTNGSKTHNITPDAKSINNENSSKEVHLTSNTDDSNTKISRVCNDISNTSAASNSSDTRSMSSARAGSLTIVTSSSSCSRTSAISRDISNNSNNRTSSDTNNNNREAVNNNSGASRQSVEAGRTPTLTSGRKVYGLRPRSSRRRLWVPDHRPTAEDEPSEPPADSSVPSELDSVGAKGSHGSSSKSKQSRGSNKTRGSRTKPLSKYRRITANARERERMKEINTAFAALRAALPTIADYRIASMTKYTTLQLASSYIRDLSKLLDEAPSSDSDNKKENCPSYLHGALTSSNRRDVNLSVGISELSFERNQQSGSEVRPGEFSVFPNNVNSINNITEEQLEGLGEIGNLSDMCWALDFMLD